MMVRRGGATRISVIGLGKLGAPLAAVLASKGYQVVGVDRNPKFVAALAAGQTHTIEPGLAELLAQPGIRLDATTDVDAAVQQSEVTFVVVPTPSAPDGSFSNAQVIAALRDIGALSGEKTAVMWLRSPAPSCLAPPAGRCGRRLRQRPAAGSARLWAFVTARSSSRSGA